MNVAVTGNILLSMSHTTRLLVLCLLRDDEMEQPKEIRSTNRILDTPLLTTHLEELTKDSVTFLFEMNLYFII